MSCKPRKFILPDLVSHCTYPLRISPHSAPVARASEKWLLSGANFTDPKRITAFMGLKAGELTAMCYPDADEEQLRVCSDFMNFLFNLDDWSDEFDVEGTHGLGDCVIKMLCHPDTYKTDKMVGKMARCFWKRFAETAGPGCQKRFIDTFDLFFRAVTQQARDRAKGVVPDLESYITLRRDTSGCKPCFALVEYGAGIDLPNEVAQHPVIQALEQSTNDLITWSNDIFSYNVEQSRGDTHNMIVVLQRQRGLTLQQAVDVIGDLCKRSIDDFEANRACVPSWGNSKVDRDVQLYIQGLQDWIVGSLHWSFDSERYFGKDGMSVKRRRRITLMPKAQA